MMWKNNNKKKYGTDNFVEGDVVIRGQMPQLDIWENVKVTFDDIKGIRISIRYPWGIHGLYKFVKIISF